MKFSAQLRTARKKLKLTQAQYAAKIGVPLDTLRNWEQGKSEPSPILQASFFAFARIRLKKDK